MSTVQTVIAIVVGIIAVLAFLAAALAYVKSSIDKATIVTLEKNGDALTARVVVLEKEVQRLEGEGKAKDARIAAVERENALLQRQRPSAEAIAALDKRLMSHHDQTMKLLKARP